MMEKQELITKINEALAGEFEVEITDISPRALIKETLHLDSLALVDMVALIETTFKVGIKGADINRIKTFDNLYDIIHKQLNA
ncbi:MAG: phosphopantetheine-binding protein [Tannerella sp.]|jgi:acyl carrier protein|nr:phosphopantetheine-binding protein [Tannerella sp.]